MAEEKEIMSLNDEQRKDSRPYEEVDEHTFVMEQRIAKPKNHSLGIVAGLVGLALTAGVIGYGAYNYMSNGTATYSSVPAAEVMQSPELKAKKLDPTQVYNLSEAKDSFGGMTITIKKAQFRQDATRLWLKVDNDSGVKINTMMSLSASLVDEDGHTYKADAFASDNVSSIAPDAHEEIMLVFEPIRADASHITFNLDNVMDMKKSAWNYSIGFDIP